MVFLTISWRFVQRLLVFSFLGFMTFLGTTIFGNAIIIGKVGSRLETSEKCTYTSNLWCRCCYRIRSWSWVSFFSTHVVVGDQLLSMFLLMVLSIRPNCFSCWCYQFGTMTNRLMLLIGAAELIVDVADQFFPVSPSKAKRIGVPPLLRTASAKLRLWDCP